MQQGIRRLFLRSTLRSGLFLSETASGNAGSTGDISTRFTNLTTKSMSVASESRIIRASVEDLHLFFFRPFLDPADAFVRQP